MTVGERIRDLRKKKGYSQEELADQLNMSRQAVAKWEKDICEPNLECLTSMSKIFEVDLDFLITGETVSYDKTSNGFQENEIEIASESNRSLDRKDIILLITLIVSLIVFIGLFVYAVLNPLYWKQSYSFIWWYIRFEVSSGTWFRVLALISVIGIVVSLILFLRRRSTNKKKK